MRWGLRSTRQRFFAPQHHLRPSFGSLSNAAAIPKSSQAYAVLLTRENSSHAPSERELERRFGGPKAGDTIVLAMSGGVDSSLCASLLRSSPLNFDLRGVYMRNWNTLDESTEFEPGSGGASGCEWQREWKDVQAVCEHLGGIPLQMKDLSKEYWTNVFEPALDCWAEGRTPNPDVSCNREIKFGALVKVLFQDGDPELKQRAADGKAWLATGHYAGIRWERDEEGRPRPRLTRCKDENKDQSYYLSSVSEEALALVSFTFLTY
jgi:tRNA-5-taurinomethyluridine 2-sulfurtransferase